MASTNASKSSERKMAMEEFGELVYKHGLIEVPDQDGPKEHLNVDFPEAKVAVRSLVAPQAELLRISLYAMKMPGSIASRL
jgi:hypothetical protein